MVEVKVLGMTEINSEHYGNLWVSVNGILFMAPGIRHDLKDMCGWNYIYFHPCEKMDVKSLQPAHPSIVEWITKRGWMLLSPVNLFNPRGGQLPRGGLIDYNLFGKGGNKLWQRKQ